MKEFIIEAAKEISTNCSFEHDPIIQFQSYHKYYYIWLLGFMLNMLILVYDVIHLFMKNEDETQKESGKTSPRFKTSLILIFLEENIYLNLTMQVIAWIDLWSLIIWILTGIYSQLSLKVKGYRIHANMVIISSFIAIPALGLHSFNAFFFIFRWTWYVYAKNLEGYIYSSLVFNTLKSIQDAVARSQYLMLFKKIRDPRNAEQNLPRRLFPMLDWRILR